MHWANLGVSKMIFPHVHDGPLCETCTICNVNINKITGTSDLYFPTFIVLNTCTSNSIKDNVNNTYHGSIAIINVKTVRCHKREFQG